MIRMIDDNGKSSKGADVDHCGDGQSKVQTRCTAGGKGSRLMEVRPCNAFVTRVVSFVIPASLERCSKIDN